MSIHKCPVCGKQFPLLYPKLWGYKSGSVYLCTYSCMRTYENEGADNMQKVTLEQKKKAVEIAISGDSPLEYLRSCGSKAPEKTWYAIKSKLRHADPEKFAQIPDFRKKHEEDEPAPETVKLNGPVKIETPEGKTLAKIDVPKVVPVAPPFKYRTTGISTAVGDFQYYKRNDYLDWTPIGNCNDTVSLKVEEWKELLKVLPEVAKVLGVSL